MLVDLVVGHVWRLCWPGMRPAEWASTSPCSHPGGTQCSILGWWTICWKVPSVTGTATGPFGGCNQFTSQLCTIAVNAWKLWWVARIPRVPLVRPSRKWSKQQCPWDIQHRTWPTWSQTQRDMCSLAGKICTSLCRRDVATDGQMLIFSCKPSHSLRTKNRQSLRSVLPDGEPQLSHFQRRQDGVWVCPKIVFFPHTCYMLIPVHEYSAWNTNHWPCLLGQKIRSGRFSPVFGGFFGGSMVGPSSGSRPMCPIRPVSSPPWTWQCSRTAAAVPRFCFRPVPVHPKSPWTRTAAWRTFQCHFDKNKTWTVFSNVSICCTIR